MKLNIIQCEYAKWVSQNASELTVEVSYLLYDNINTECYKIIPPDISEV